MVIICNNIDGETINCNLVKKSFIKRTEKGHSFAEYIGKHKSIVKWRISI